MITQKIKGWLQKLCAWWPWKKSTPIEYQHMSNVVTRGPTTETTPWPEREATAPQSGITPCLSALENQSESMTQPQPEASDPDPLPSPTTWIDTDPEPVEDAELVLADAPTTQRRLEFLRYLVRRGIVNEGVETEESNS